MTPSRRGARNAAAGKRPATREAAGAASSRAQKRAVPADNHSRMLRILLVLFLLALTSLSPSPGARRPHAPAWEPDSVPDAFSRPAAVLTWPGAGAAFQVGPDGGLCNGVWRVDVAAFANGRRAAPPRRIAYEERWRPVAHWTERAGDVRWDFEAVALPAPEPALTALERDVAAWRAVRAAREARAASAARGEVPEERERADRVAAAASLPPAPGSVEEVPLVVSVLATALNTGDRPERVTLDLTLAPMSDDEAWHEAGARRTPPWGWCAPGADSALGWCGAPAAGRSARREADLEPGESYRVHFVAASRPLPSAGLAAWSRVAHATRAREARGWWTRELARGTRFRLGDPEVESAIRAARCVLLSCRERRGGHWVPLDRPFPFHDAAIGDGARAIAALAAHGYTREARELTETYLGWPRPRGAFASPAGTPDGASRAVWAFGQATLRPEAAGDAADYARAAWDAWNACERARHSKAAAGRPGLLPATDPQAGNGPGAGLVGNDAWALASYTATERLLRAAGREADADRVADSRRGYRITFVRAIARSGSGDVPASYAGGGRDLGNLAVAYPCDALPATSPRVAAMARRYREAARHPGLGYWGSPDSLHGYLAADLATWAMRAGQRADAEATLDALLAWRNASGGACELFTRGGDYGMNAPPHAGPAAALLQLVRNCVIDDDGERLALTQGARARWWRGARIENAPTRWGSVSLAFVRADGRARWRWTPVPVWTELALPPGTRLAADPPLPLVRGSRPDLVLAPPGTAQAGVEVEPAPQPRRSQPRPPVAGAGP
jgi:hypothetical protein